MAYIVMIFYTNIRGDITLKNKRILKPVYSALFAALIFSSTQFILIPLPFGYLNFGDCFVLLSAVIVGGPYAIMASAIGTALADVLSGYTVYAPATLIIKSLMVIAITAITKIGTDKSRKIKTIFKATGAAVAELIMVCGYFIYDSILYSFLGAIAALPGNIIQGIAAVISSMVIITVLEHSGIMQHIQLQ